MTLFLLVVLGWLVLGMIAGHVAVWRRYGPADEIPFSTALGALTALAVVVLLLIELLEWLGVFGWYRRYVDWLDERWGQ